MNEVEQILHQAQRSHRKRLLIVSAVIASIIGLATLVYLSTVIFGRVIVVVAPTEAATNAQIEIIDGGGFVTGSSIWGLKRDLKIKVSASGYETEEILITHATWERAKLDVIMREILAVLKVTVIPNLPDIQWYLNDALVREGASLNIRLNSGDYSISAKHPYYVSQTQSLTVIRGENYDLELHLKPIKGEIFVTSEPNGAEVITDTGLSGVTPINLEVKGGVHELTISSDGYDSQTDSITIDTSSQTMKRHYQLARSMGTISLKLSPKGGTISLNGKVVTVLNNKILLPMGSRHNLRYAKEGFNTQSVDFIVAEKDNTVAVRLTPVYGSVTVFSQPQAKIEINGKEYGQTPQQLKIHAVPQTVTLSAPGYRPQSRTVTPDEDSPLEVFVTLETERDYRMKNAPMQYSNSAGIEMKLFKNPDLVTLGAPRGEVGRRANEFVREVRLSRPFYAAIHEVTTKQFDQFKSPGQSSTGNNRPVASINWISAAMFCNWLSQKEGLAPVYLFSGGQFVGSEPSADGYRMLTEAEWEWLARKAGRAQQTMFPWGDSKTIPRNSGNIADESAKGSVEQYIPNYRDGSAKIAETGKFATNPAGLHDLAGNVKEWVHDIYSLRPPRQTQVKDDTLDSGDSLRRTIKGSSWKSGTLTELRASWRDGGDSAGDDVGFRIGRYLY